MNAKFLVAPIATLAILVTSPVVHAQAVPGRTAAVEAPPALSGATVKSKQGQVKGFIVNNVNVFRGLPFAAPPVGDLRWRAPQSPAKWSDVRAANVAGGNCQAVEDCLYLNVYMPANSLSNLKLPVMVWIHGGAFIFGSGSTYDGTQFARQNLIVVTVNYRLGRAGWFAHPAITDENKKDELGNYGLMDQVAALKWVQDNIAAFSGDSKNVTVFGESAGAISINYLMLAPQAKGLFHKAISQSGFGRLAAMPVHAEDDSMSGEKVGVSFATKAGITGDDSAALKALRALSWADLNKGTGGVGSVDQPLPMADGRYITGSVAEGFAAGKQARVPYLLGGNSDEASLTRRSVNAAEVLAAIQDGRSEFLNAFDPDKTGDAARTVARLVTDQTISEPDRELARLHAKSGQPTYVYHFSYVPAAQRATSFGLAHGGEITYVFNTPMRTTFDDEGKAVAAAANNYWAAFAKHGDPSNAGGVAWPKFDAADEAVLEFPSNGVPVLRQHFHKSRLDWVESHLPKPASDKPAEPKPEAETKRLDVPRDTASPVRTGGRP
ncbi:MAG TPA: carboxylesterase family protein [Steroidobacteraceae bacterium]|nr:carboxylesterase family protein [Steroidobacteraceae bacterium]